MIDVNNSSRYQLTYNNNGSVKVLFKVLPNLKSDLTVYFNSTSQKYIQNIDQSFANIPTINHGNYYHTYGVSLRSTYSHESISADVIANYETTTLHSDLFLKDYNQNIISISGDVKFPVINNKYFVPSVFGKISSFDGKMLKGYGADISGSIINHISYYVGISNFEKQISLVEKEAYIYNNYVSLSPSNNSALELGIEFDYKSLLGKIVYFNF